MAEANSWGNKVIPQILLHVDFIITEVNELETIRSLFYKSEKYPAIVALINSKDWDGLKKFDDQKQEGFSEYLSILKFRDQNRSPHVVTVYDSDELWQDPEIIDIFLLS